MAGAGRFRLKSAPHPSNSRRMTHSPLLLLALLTVLGSARAPRAEEVVIGQKGKAFTRTEVVLKKGDSIVFVNDDAVTHNVFSRSDGFKFNLKMQKPGEQKK